MPGFILHQGATVLCMHAGQAQPMMPSPRVTVSSQAVATQAGPYVVAGCPFNIIVPIPCVTAQWIMAAMRVMVGGVPVVLQDSQAICVPNGTPLNIIVTQIRVKGS
jgi:hypothetical protein